MESPINPKSRACFFVTSAQPTSEHHKVNEVNDGSSCPFIKVPFPSMIDLQKLVTSKADGKLPRSPNAFIIYRKAFVEAAKAEGYCLPMTVISAMASQQWEQKESDETRAYYKRLAREVFEYKKKMYPSKPASGRKKRVGWSVVSFRKDEKKTRAIEKEVESSISILTPPQLLTPIQSENTIQTFDFGDFSALELPSSDIFTANSPPVLEQLHDNLLAVGNVYPSPEFSTINNSVFQDFSTTNFSFSPDFSNINNSYLPPDFSTANISISPNLEELFAPLGAQPPNNIFQTEEQNYNMDSLNSDAWEFQSFADDLLLNNIDELQISNEALDTFGICNYQY